jgi:hypothetical protein
MKNYLMETAIWYWDAVLLSTTVIVAVPEEWVLIELYFLKMNYEDESYFNDIVCLILLICLNWRRNWYFIIILFRLSNYKHSIPDRILDNLISRLVIFDGCRMVGTLSHINVAYTLTDIFYFHWLFALERGSVRSSHLRHNILYFVTNSCPTSCLMCLFRRYGVQCDSWVSSNVCLIYNSWLELEQQILPE